MEIKVTKDVVIELNQRRFPATLSVALPDAPGDASAEEVMAAVRRAVGGTPGGSNGDSNGEVKAAPTSSVHHLLGESWKAPKDMHGKALKTTHRILMGVYDSTQRGFAATAKDVQDRTHISLVPIYNVMKPDTPTGKYASKYLLVGDQGRNKTLDLTPEGKHLVSLMRAGKVPY